MTNPSYRQRIEISSYINSSLKILSPAPRAFSLGPYMQFSLGCRICCIDDILDLNDSLEPNDEDHYNKVIEFMQVPMDVMSRS